MTQSIEPTVSVVIPARNEEKFIRTAIDSIREQSYENLEIIVIDDYSTDATVDVVKSIDEPRLRLHRKTSEPVGAATSRNLGIHLSRGALIAYQDADDYSHPRRIELQVKECISGSRPRVVGCWVEERTGSRSRVRRLPVRHEEIVGGFYRAYNRVTVVSGAVLLPRAVAIAVPMRNRFRCFEDWDQMCRIGESRGIEFRNVPRALYTYNLRPKGSKSLGEWSRHNIFERACRARRRAGLEEWLSLADFERHLSGHISDRIWWGAVRGLLQIKVALEMKQVRKGHGNEFLDSFPAATWHPGITD